MKIFLGIVCTSLVFFAGCNDSISIEEIEPNSVVIDSDNNEEITIDNGALISIPIPENFTVLREAMGELNGEIVKAVVYDTDTQTDFGTQRELHIYRLSNNQWQLWHENSTAVLSSQSGGVMGDPFEDITIQEGAIAIEHFGGSRHKWMYTHQYKNINSQWKLTQATIQYGVYCDYFENLNYDLMTGNVIYEKELELCDDLGNLEATEINPESKTFSKNIDELPNIDDFIPGENEIKIPESETVMYF